MKDCPQRRNRIAAIVTQHYAQIASTIAKAGNADNAYQIDARVATATYLPILAALAGETRPKVLGIDPISLPAMQIESLTSEDPS